jgi:lipid A 4'-phosphatase
MFTLSRGLTPLRYLRLQRTRMILAAFLASALLLAAFPEVDLNISRLFFDGRFYLAEESWTRLLHKSVGYFVILSMASVSAIFVLNRFSKRNLWGIDGKKLLYLFLVLALGAGLIVNVIFKDNFGRARPRNVEEFGGAQTFTPAFVIARSCERNCSFSSGDGAAAFFSLALTIALSRRRSIAAAAVGFGVAVSLARIASGAHFFSDTVADALRHYMRLPSPEVVSRRLRRKAALLPAPP